MDQQSEDRAAEFAALPVATALKQLQSRRSGLTLAEARSRLRQVGRNEFWQERGFDWLRFGREQVFNPFNIILAGVAFLAWWGGAGRLEVGLVVGFLVVAILIALVSERRFHHLYRQLQKWLAKKVLVVRDGHARLCPVEQLAPGDIVQLTKGEKIPADARVIRAVRLLVDESALTGESEPVTKDEESHAALYSGTEIIDGECHAVVVATGQQTTFAHLGSLTLRAEKRSTYQRELERFSLYLTRVTALFVVTIFAINFWFKGFDMQSALSFSLVLGISVIPEFLPPITAFTLAQASHLFARHKNIVKRLSAIEDLGLIDVLCVDKTGTLTTNNLKLVKIDSQRPDEVVFYTALSAHGVAQKYLSDYATAVRAALSGTAHQALTERLERAKLLDRELFDPHERVSRYLVREGSRTHLVVIGAPEALLERCKLTPAARKKWGHLIEEHSLAGLRVYAVGTKEAGEAERVRAIYDRGLTWLGMGIFEDELKDGAREALQQAEDLGVEIKILTGDHPEVAAAVARELGLIEERKEVWSEDELSGLTARRFDHAVADGAVFARVRPETKYKIVQALQRSGRQVGFLGEGMNDMPVMKLANVGIAVDTAVDATKEVADIIILEKDLGVIVNGLVQGRRVFFNILKYLKHTMSDNFGNFFSIGLLSLSLTFFPITPLQILLTDLLTDLPLFAVAYDSVDERDLRRPAQYRLRQLFILLVSLGSVAAIFNLLAFWMFRDSAPAVIQTVLLVQATLSGLVVFYSIRTNRWCWQAPGSRFVLSLIAGSFILLSLVLYVPLLRGWWGLAAMPLPILGILIVLNLLYLLVTDTVKMLVNNRVLARPTD